MILNQALRGIPRRLQQPVLLASILAYFAVVILSLFTANGVVHLVAAASPVPPGLALPTGHLLILTSTNLIGIVLLFSATPLAWQWTGDDRRLCPPLRAMAQFTLYYLGIAGLQIWVTLDIQKASFLWIEKSLPGLDYRLLLLPGFLIGLVFQGLIGFALALWEKRKAEKGEAERQAEEARWTLLKAQMSPHVLLNSLNGLAELVREDTVAAVKGMRDLAEIYGQLLSLGEAPTVPLGQERCLLERYLSVEQLRLGERLTVEWDWQEGLDELPAMPLLLQPLVENAIKHGVAADPKGGLIRIRARRREQRLLLEVANTGCAPPSHNPAHVRRRSGGVGLRNLKSRLEMAYHGKASFDLVKESPWTRASLDLPMLERES